MKRENSLPISIAVLLCVTLLTGSTPPQTTSPPTQIAPVMASSAQAVPPEPLKASAVARAPGQAATDPARLAPVPGAKLGGVRSGEECPFNSMFAQVPTDPNDSWSCATSAVTTSFEYLVQENFSGVNSSIHAIDWWGLSLLYDSGWSACDPEGVTFDIILYEDNDGTPGDAVCAYTGLTAMATNTRLSYSGYEVYYFQILSLNPECCLNEGWVSIQSQMNDDDCAFLWASSPDGDGDSLQGGQSTYYDRAMCLPSYLYSYGACCDDYTGVCEDDVLIIECDTRYVDGTLCADIDPPCGTLGACCVDLVCEATTYEVDCAGTWYEGETCPDFACLVPCPDTQIDITILTDSWASDTSWEITDHVTGEVVYSGGDYEDETWYRQRYCILETDCLDFTIHDSYGDGIIAPGGYIVTLDDVELANTMGGRFTGSEESIEEISCVLDTGACCYTFGDDIRCANNREFECDALDGDWYADEDCCTFRCPEWGCLESTIDITILTDSWGSETSWEVTDHVTGEAVCSGGDYENDTWYYERCCILETDCVDFTIYDSYGDGIITPGGYILYVDGEEIANAMNGGFDDDEDTVASIGGGCAPSLGACCVELACVATNPWIECDALGGTWYEGESCPEFTCPFEYCTPCHSDFDDDYITNVTFNTINNDTGAEGAPCSYGDYTNISTTVEREETYQLSVSLDGNGSWTQYVSVWFDWDENTTFETAYELGSVVITPGTPVTIAGDITIPADAGFGVKRMRVMQRYCQSTVDPCEVYAYGEAEDYTLVVVSGVCGDLDYDADVDTDDYYIFLDTFGTCAGDTEYYPAADFDGDQCITLVDYQMWMDCYNAANGKRL